MDFARPLTREDSAVSKSKIRYIPVLDSDVDAEEPPSLSGGSGEAARRPIHVLTGIETVRNHGQDHSSGPQREDEDGKINRQLIRAANRAAASLFGANDEELPVDSARFPDRMLPPPDSLIKAGDLVVLQLAFDHLDFIYVTPGQVYHNRNGKFPHDQFVGMPFGSKVRSADKRGFGYLFLLKPTPELWVRSLNHRTQIIHELDSSQIVFQLYLRPNVVVIETGTGSAGLSHAIARSIAPRGHLHTYEFNKVRAETARADFERNGLEHLVTVHHGDSCADGFPNLSNRSADAASLDLPEPWRAVPHCARALKIQGRIASYSPCVEQAQRTVQALEDWGFHSVVTMEYRLLEHYVDQVAYDPPPVAKRPKIARDKRIETTLGSASGEEVGDGSNVEGRAEEDVAEDSPPFADTSEGGGVTLGGASRNNRAALDRPLQQQNFSMGSLVEAGNDSHLNGSSGVRRMVVARPFTSMRGHTAFLTFGTLGNRKSKVCTRDKAMDGE
jgi:tRNA (adenine57-N1/adenine58-N1)-methyltransferase